MPSRADSSYEPSEGHLHALHGGSLKKQQHRQESPSSSSGVASVPPYAHASSESSSTAAGGGGGIAALAQHYHHAPRGRGRRGSDHHHRGTGRDSRDSSHSVDRESVKSDGRATVADMDVEQADDEPENLSTHEGSSRSDPSQEQGERLNKTKILFIATKFEPKISLPRRIV